MGEKEAKNTMQIEREGERERGLCLVEARSWQTVPLGRGGESFCTIPKSVPFPLVPVLGFCFWSSLTYSAASVPELMPPRDGWRGRAQWESIHILPLFKPCYVVCEFLFFRMRGLLRLGYIHSPSLFIGEAVAPITSQVFPQSSPV